MKPTYKINVYVMDVLQYWVPALYAIDGSECLAHKCHFIVCHCQCRYDAEFERSYLEKMRLKLGLILKQLPDDRCSKCIVVHVLLYNVGTNPN